MPFLRLFCLGRPDIESGCHAGEKGVIALRNGVFDRAVERRLERLHGVRVVCAEGHLFGTVPGKATGMAARILHISTSEAVIRARAHHDIRLLCAVPHDHQSDRFPPSWKKRYNVCLVNSDAVRVFASNYFSGCFSVRNRFMVDSSSLLICYFDGQAGGTAQTVHYAQGSGLRIINLSPRAYDQLSLL